MQIQSIDFDEGEQRERHTERIYVRNSEIDYMNEACKFLNVASGGKEGCDLDILRGNHTLN